MRRFFRLLPALAMRAHRIHNFTIMPSLVRRPKRMPLAQLFYNTRYRTGEYALRSFMVLLPWIPYRWLEVFTSGMARLAFMLMWKYRRRMEESVTRALGERIS